MDLLSSVRLIIMAAPNRIFAEKLETDPREPLFVWDIPQVGPVALLGTSMQFWTQMFALMLVHVVLNVTAALLAYQFVLNKKKRRTQAYLVGFGVICPLLVYVPFWLMQVLDLRNPMLKLVTVSTPALVIFHCLETMFGTLPTFATKSFGAFVWYFASAVEFRVDKQTQQAVPVTPRALKQKCRSIGVIFVQCMALYSILVPVNYNIFPRRAPIRSLSDLFYWGNLGNNYLMGALTKASLEFGMSTLGLLVSYGSGYSTASISDYPLTRTSSPSDFWGKRWNTCVSSRLKRAIYLPIRTQLGLSKAAASLLTFAASGILHEYFLAATAFRYSGDDNYEFHLIGGHLLFFLWNAVVLILEGLLRGTTMIRLVEECLPKPARTALVFLTVLPIVNLFTDQFVSLGLYAGGFGLGFPQLRQWKIAD